MRIPLLLFFLLFCTGAWAQEVAALAQPAKSVVGRPPLQLRQPSAERLQELRASKDFRYEQDLRPDVSFWERFWRHIGDFLDSLLKGKGEYSFWRYLLYALAIGISVYVILKLLDVQFDGLFGRKVPAAALAYETYRENIHEIDFKALLEEAETQKDYRRAVRLYYLLTLKTLTDQGLIQWKPGKTNWSYVQELQGSDLRPRFMALTQSFEYIWYGGSPLEAPAFTEVRQAFLAFTQSLNPAAV